MNEVSLCDLCVILLGREGVLGGVPRSTVACSVWVQVVCAV